MANFDDAIPVLLLHEGGVADIGDGEGVTAYGWTEDTCRRLGVAQPTNSEQAATLYREHFWPEIYDKIASQDAATKLFDDVVNQGNDAAVRTLQRALCSAKSTVQIDGVFGPFTLTALNFVPDVLLLPWWRWYQFETFERWIAQDRRNRTKFRDGLGRRAAWPDPDGSIAKALLALNYNPGATNATTP